MAASEAPAGTRPGAPVPLVICADDFALHAGVSTAIVELADRGRISATSAMVLSPHWPRHAERLTSLRDRLDVGLHLDWTSAFARAAGHGMSLRAAMLRAVAGGFDRAAARGQVEAQLDAFERVWQRPPDHLDGHQHVHQFAGIRQAVVEVLARRYGAQAPWLRISRVPPAQRSAKTSVIALLGAAALQRLARTRGLPCAPALSGVYGFSGGADAYARHMDAWLASSPAGAVLMCHPGHPPPQRGVPGSRDVPDPIAAARGWELAHLGGAEFAHQLRRHRVTIIRGSQLRSRWLG